MTAYLPTLLVLLTMPAIPPIKPPPLRFLKGADLAKALAFGKQVAAAEKAEQWDQAIAAAKELASFRSTRQGRQHWEVFNAQLRVHELEVNAQRLLAERIELQRGWQLRSEADRLYTAGQVGAALAKAGQSLSILERYLGPKNPHIAVSLDDLAQMYQGQAQYAKAKPLYQRALAVFEESLPPTHPYIATTLNNLGTLNYAQAQYAKAEPLYLRALAIREQSLSPNQLDIAISLNNLAALYTSQAQYTKAETLYLRALTIREQTLAPGHPDIASSLKNLATVYDAQAQYVKAEPFYLRALAIEERSLPPGHPHIARSLDNLAGLYKDRALYTKAEPLLERAVATLERGRGHLSRRGRDRAAVAQQFTAPMALALLRARLGRAGSADLAERALARGFFEDLADQQAHLLTPTDREQRARLQRQLAQLEAAIDQFVRRRTSADQAEELAGLRRQHSAAQSDLTHFLDILDAKYGVKLGQPYAIQRIQAQLAADTALVAWPDQGKEHWVFVVRAQGEPAWVNLAPSAPWGKSDEILAASFARACAERHSLTSLPHRLAEQRLAPLAPTLAAHDGLPAVGHLVVLTSPALTGVPLAALRDEYTVSYAPSGTIYAWLRENRAAFQQRRQRQPVDLLALGDPIFDESTNSNPAPPKQGVLLASISKGSPAEKAGLRDGDVLLRYAETPLDGLPALSQAIQREPAKPAVIRFWRQGRELTGTVPGGKLGVQLDRRTPQQAFADAMLHRSGAERWPPLPGTRREVAAIARLVQANGGTATTLLGADAAEPVVTALAEKDGFRRYRYLHFATHGAMNLSAAYASSLILSQVGLPDSYDQWRKNEPIWDGKITAAEMLDWKLDADLVVLSACSTARGQDLGVEGTNSFAPALLLAGARSVIVSLWEVEDNATALLMQRLYENILVRKQPKARALKAAQDWLRNLNRSEAGAALARLPRGVSNVAQPVQNTPSASGGAADRPYAHPYFWAAFVLVGDPE